jgi:hypothetical protein
MKLKPVILLPMVLVNVLEIASQAAQQTYDHATQVAQQLAAQQAAQAQSDGPSAITLTLIGQTVILLTTLAGFAYNIYRENRNRRWDLEDRKVERKKAADQLTNVSHQVNEVDQTVQRVRGDHNIIVRKIDRAAEIAAEAAAGNHALESRIAELSKMFEATDAPGPLLARVDANTQKTVEILTEGKPDDRSGQDT